MKKNILIVTAHPSSLGFTHKIAEAYKAGSEEVGNTVEILDLYKTDLKQDFLKFENPHDMGNPDTVRDIMKKKITDANELVFVHPMWWISPPAIMKNWLDNNLSSGFAFKYENGRPVGLLKGKTARVFITCDGAMWLYWLIAKPFWTIWNFGILGFCGLKVKGITVLDKKFKRTDAEKEAFLDKVKKSAK
ncbi:MAG: NAD(P)H-dependent oxidoreductase [bacterium]